MNGPIVVTGATGNVGSKIVGLLAAKGRKVRAVARGEARLKGLPPGVEKAAAALEDVSALAAAFQGASSAFLLLPPDYADPDQRARQRRLGAALLSAAERSGLRRVVFLSSVGAQADAGTGLILGLHDFEERLKASGLDAVALRPGYFMENHLWSIPLIKGRGILGSPLKGDVPIPMIATADIAAEAARLLDDAAFNGFSARELAGPRALTMAEATRILGEAVGKPALPYVQVPYEDARGVLKGTGMSADTVDKMLEMQRGFNEGGIVYETASVARTPTTLERFAAEVFAPAYRAA